MTSRATWRALAITYGVATVMQLYLAVTMRAPWAWILAATCAAAGAACSVAACLRSRDSPGTDLASAHVSHGTAACATTSQAGGTNRDS